MKRDTLKTLAGLIIIGGIVVATFMYGNAQRKAQLTRDQDVKKQQEAKNQQSSSPVASATNTPTPASSPTPTNNTAPVQTPGSNNIQGSASPTPTSTPKPTASPLATSGAVQGAAAGSNLPETGPELAGMLGLGAITGMVVAVRGSRRAMLDAARSKRVR